MTTDFENEVRKSEEINTMVRKASELKSLDELNLPKKIYSILKKQAIDPQKLILLVRVGVNIKGIGPKTFEQLYKAVDEAGFIRHDFDRRSFGIMDFYNSLRGYDETRRFYSNESYENFCNYTEEQIKKAIMLIEDVLSEQEAKEVKFCFHLEENADNCNLSDEDESCIFEIGPECELEEIESYEDLKEQICEKMWADGNLYRLEYLLKIPSDEKCQANLNDVMGELAELYENPVFKRERELKNKIFKISRYSSFERAKRMNDFIEKYAPLPLQVLDLSSLCRETYARCTRLDMQTIGDFVMFCFRNPKDWHNKIAGFSFNSRCVESVVERVAKMGCDLPLADEVLNDDFQMDLEYLELSDKTLAAINHLGRLNTVGDFIMACQQSPDDWFRFCSIDFYGWDWECAKEVSEKVIALGFEVPPFGKDISNVNFKSICRR